MAIAIAVPAAVNLPAGDDSGPPVAAAPHLVEIPPEALLQPEDVGPNLVALRETIAQHESLDGLHLLSGLAVTCPAYRSLSRYSGTYRYQRSYTVQTPPTDPGDPTTGEPVLRQIVLRLDDGLAYQVAFDLKTAAVKCADYVWTGPAEGDAGTVDVEATHRWRVVYEGFAGEQSFVFTHAVGVKRVADGRPFADPGTYLQAVVQVGDLVSLISWVQPGVDPLEARRLATRAAGWLCVASNPPC